MNNQRVSYTFFFSQANYEAWTVDHRAPCGLCPSFGGIILLYIFYRQFSPCRFAIRSSSRTEARASNTLNYEKINDRVAPQQTFAIKYLIYKPHLSFGLTERRVFHNGIIHARHFFFSLSP